MVKWLKASDVEAVFDFLISEYDKKVYSDKEISTLLRKYVRFLSTLHYKALRGFRHQLKKEPPEIKKILDRWEIESYYKGDGNV